MEQMAEEQSNLDELMRALNVALADDWDGAHAIVQGFADDPTACWLHAVLHKIEGDEANSRYWYERTSMDYERFSDAKAELRAIHHQLTHERKG